MKDEWKSISYNHGKYILHASFFICANLYSWKLASFAVLEGERWSVLDLEELHVIPSES